MLVHCSTTFKLGGRFLALGRLSPSSLTADYLEQRLSASGLDIPKQLKDHPRDAPVPDHLFFECLGYDEALSSDKSAYEASEVIHDLNEPTPPPEWIGQFDVVYNNGTIEHVFNVPNALNSCHELLKPNGVVIHAGPANNTVDHGFYQLSPTLFFDYYRANEYEILNCALIKSSGKDGHSKISIQPYNTYDNPTDHLYGKMGDGVWTLLFVARKTEKSTSDKVPTQFRYAHL